MTLLLVVLGGLAMIVGAYLLIGQVVDVTDAAITPAQRFTAAFATATALGALTALVLNIRKQDFAEQLARREITAAFTERFRSAAAQLGGQSPAERLAGVYAMAALADEYPSRRQQCVDVLCGYLRLPYDPATDTIATTTTSTTTETGDGPVTTQTTAAARPFDREVRTTIITVVREHTHPNASPSWSQLNFNLRGSHLADVDLRHSAFLGRIVFQSATFTGEPTLVANAVQRNADPYYYTPFWAPAGEVTKALGGIKEQAGATATSPAGTPQSSYALGPVKQQTATVANTVGPMFGIKTAGGYRDPQAEQYDPNGHPAGLAIDFMTNDIPDGKATGDRLAKYLQDHSAELGVKYIIWHQHIWSVERADEGWRPMADRGSPTQNHMDHVHLSLTGDGSSTIPGCGPGGLPGEVSQTGWAVPAQGPITSGFGPRKSPGGVGSTYHRGIDLGGGGCYGPIWAANKGQVVTAGPSSGYGNLIEIDHGGGVHTRYGHMFNDGLMVKIGDQVSAGQQIAKVGTTGNSTGCHLHFEVLMNGQQVDPKAFLDKVNVTIK